MNSDWIKCSDRVPTESGRYLVTVSDDDGSVVLNAWYNTRFNMFSESIGWTLLNEWYDLTNQLRDYIVA